MRMEGTLKFEPKYVSLYFHPADVPVSIQLASFALSDKKTAHAWRLCSDY